MSLFCGDGAAISRRQPSGQRGKIKYYLLVMLEVRRDPQLSASIMVSTQYRSKINDCQQHRPIRAEKHIHLFHGQSMDEITMRTGLEHG